MIPLLDIKNESSIPPAPLPIICLIEAAYISMIFFKEIE